jgi:sulfate/thiosulfate-binding protein
LKEAGGEKFELVAPSISILAEPPVAWVDKVVKRHGTQDVAEAYLQYLYTPEGQEIAAKNFYRPRLESIAQKHEATFPKIKLFTIDELFGGWQQAQKTHFGEGGIFDQIQSANR